MEKCSSVLRFYGVLVVCLCVRNTCIYPRVFMYRYARYAAGTRHTICSLLTAVQVNFRLLNLLERTNANCAGTPLIAHRPFSILLQTANSRRNENNNNNQMPPERSAPAPSNVRHFSLHGCSFAPGERAAERTKIRIQTSNFQHQRCRSLHKPIFASSHFQQLARGHGTRHRQSANKNCVVFLQ